MTHRLFESLFTKSGDVESSRYIRYCQVRRPVGQGCCIIAAHLLLSIKAISSVVVAFFCILEYSKNVFGTRLL